MDVLFIVLLVTVLVVAAILSASYICFWMLFFVPKLRLPEGDLNLPKGKAYEPHHPRIATWITNARGMKREDVSIKSHDGLTLRGYYYEQEKGAPIEILFHGYRGTGERDMSAGIERCFSVGRNALVVDQRAHGRSDGRVTTFGVKEQIDCRRWVDFAIKKFGSDVKISLGGISMGAATVILAAGNELPENVTSVLADCSYSSAEEIIKKVVKDLRLPVMVLYPFIRLGARVFGGFSIADSKPVEAIKRTKLPHILYHGKSDGLVPYEMGVRLFEACASQKKHLELVDGADHGVAYPEKEEQYILALKEFIKKWSLS